MNSKLLFAEFVLVFSSAMAMAQGWFFSTDEVNALRSGTLRYVTEKSGCLALDICGGCEGEFDRLEVIALKDAQGQPVLPYRIRMFKGGGVRESAVIPLESIAYDNPVEKLFLDRNPFPPIKDIGDAGNECKAVCDGIARVEEKDGRRNITLLSLRVQDRLMAFNVSEGGCRDRISGLGERALPDWPIFDNGLVLRQRHSELMRPDAKLFKLIPPQKYICSWAMYEVEEPRSGWVELPTGKEHPFVLRVRIWKLEDELTRANAQCIARVVGCAKMNGNDDFKMDCEKGCDDFSLKMFKGSLGESSRTLRLRYKNAESSTYISPEMSVGEIMKLEERVKEDCRKRVEAKRVGIKPE